MRTAISEFRHYALTLKAIYIQEDCERHSYVSQFLSRFAFSFKVALKGIPPSVRLGFNLLSSESTSIFCNYRNR